MRYWRQLAVCLALFLLVGCKEEKKPSDAFEVKWPGGSVKIDPEKGVDVQAPGVDVNVDKDRGVEVKSPGADIQVK